MKKVFVIIIIIFAIISGIHYLQQKPQKPVGEVHYFQSEPQKPGGLKIIIDSTTKFLRSGTPLPSEILPLSLVSDTVYVERISVERDTIYKVFGLPDSLPEMIRVNK